MVIQPAILSELHSRKHVVVTSAVGVIDFPSIMEALNAKPTLGHLSEVTAK